MKIFLRILMVIASIIVLLCIIGLFLPSKSHVERSIVISAPAETVFEQVNNLKNWTKWSPWYKKDPNAKLTYGTSSSGEGASYSWESQNKEVGAGTLTLSEVKPYSHITENMKFRDWGDAKAEMNFAPEAAGTKVTWIMESEYGLNIPMRYIGLLMKGMLEEQFDDGLSAMKDAAEHAPISVGGINIKIQEIDTQPITAVALSGKMPEKELDKFFNTAYSEIMQFIDKNKLKAMGSPFAVYHKYDPTMIELDAAIPIDKKVATSGKFKVLDIKATHAVKADYYGAYEGIGSAHDAIDKWMKANNKKANGAPWEVYVTDPTFEKDTTKWLTEVIYPIQ